MDFFQVTPKKNKARLFNIFIVSDTSVRIPGTIKQTGIRE